MNDLVNRGSLRELALQGGERILEVGSGLGQFARLMAHAVGSVGRVIGVERSPEQLAGSAQLAQAEGEVDLVEFRQGDAVSPPLLDHEWGAFDVAHARFVLEHIPDPLAVVHNMVRAVRPGGRIVLEDDDHGVLRVWPEPPGFRELWAAYIGTYERSGNDPYVGRRLVSLLHDAGATPRRNNWIFFGGCAGSPAFSQAIENMIGILRGAKEAILRGRPRDLPFEDTLRALHHWGRRADAALWFAVCWAEGTRPRAEG